MYISVYSYLNNIRTVWLFMKNIRTQYARSFDAQTVIEPFHLVRTYFLCHGFLLHLCAFGGGASWASRPVVLGAKATRAETAATCSRVRTNFEVITDQDFQAPGESTGFPQGFLDRCNSLCQSSEFFDTLYASTLSSWLCICCAVGTRVLDSPGPGHGVWEVVPESHVDGDPHIETLDGKRYTLLSQGTFSLWHFSVVEAESQKSAKGSGKVRWRKSESIGKPLRTTQGLTQGTKPSRRAQPVTVNGEDGKETRGLQSKTGKCFRLLMGKTIWAVSLWQGRMGPRATTMYVWTCRRKMAQETSRCQASVAGHSITSISRWSWLEGGGLKKAWRPTSLSKSTGWSVPPLFLYCRASRTGDAIRAMYSSVSVGVVHVLCVCAQVQSTVWCSCHTAACNHLTTHLFVACLCLFFFFFLLFLFFFFFLLFFFFFLFLLLLVVVVLVLVLVLLLLLHSLFSHFCGPLKIVK